MYGSDSMILVKLRETSWRRQQFDESHNNDELRVNLFLVHEIREEAQIREEVAKLIVAQRYNTKVQERVFHKEDLV